MPEEILEQQETAESTSKSVTEQPAASAAAEQQETQESEQPGPRKGGVQKRIDELTRDKHLAKLEAEFWKQKALSPGDKAEATKESVKPSVEPKLDDFATWEDYQKAVRAYDKEQIRTELEAKLQNFGTQQKQQSEAEQRQAEWHEREEAIAKVHSDYKETSEAALEVLAESKSPSVKAVATAIEGSEVGPELLHYLGQNLEEFEALVALDPKQAERALIRIELRLTDNKDSGGTKAVSHTKAPKPPTPIKGSKSVDNGELNDNLPMNEWSKRYQKKLEAS